MWITPWFSFFYVGGPSSSTRSSRTISCTGYLVPQPFATGGNRSYPYFWAIASDPWYPGYETRTVALEPSVERVVRAVHSTGGRIGTHMLLWVLPWDSVVRP
jgi:hypothetical protein